ncbi:hypothetical protein [Pedococcus sp. 5OH_020]|uniref:hypothetical protein n=1 Tax=Pedococcus sp. 5OH_020 TaxID=2989814 RepID=UPI0022E9B021|nr:hypothetical protein [Pedococcus sp. 5OH_020]
MTIVAVWVKWHSTRQDDVLDFHGNSIEAVNVVTHLQQQGFGAWDSRLHLHGRPALLDWSTVAACTVEGLSTNWATSMTVASAAPRPVHAPPRMSQGELSALMKAAQTEQL